MSTATFVPLTADNDFDCEMQLERPAVVDGRLTKVPVEEGDATVEVFLADSNESNATALLPQVPVTATWIGAGGYWHVHIEKSALPAALLNTWFGPKRPYLIMESTNGGRAFLACEYFNKKSMVVVK